MKNYLNLDACSIDVEGSSNLVLYISSKKICKYSKSNCSTSHRVILTTKLMWIVLSTGIEVQCTMQSSLRIPETEPTSGSAGCKMNAHAEAVSIAAQIIWHQCMSDAQGSKYACRKKCLFTESVRQYILLHLEIVYHTIWRNCTTQQDLLNKYSSIRAIFNLSTTDFHSWKNNKLYSAFKYMDWAYHLKQIEKSCYFIHNRA